MAPISHAAVLSIQGFLTRCVQSSDSKTARAAVGSNSSGVNDAHYLGSAQWALGHLILEESVELRQTQPWRCLFQLGQAHAGSAPGKS